MIPSQVDETGQIIEPYFKSEEAQVFLRNMGFDKVKERRTHMLLPFLPKLKKHPTTCPSPSFAL